MVVHGFCITIGVSEYGACFIEDRYAQTCLHTDVRNVGSELIPITVHIVMERMFDDLRMKKQIMFFVVQVIVVKKIHENDAEDQ